MAVVRVEIDLPYFFLLPYGEYATGAEGAILLSASVRRDANPIPRGTVASQGWAQTRISSEFDAPDWVARQSAAAIAEREAARLVRKTNRFLRWYRQLASSPETLEVTRSQVSPFWFRQADREWLVPRLDFEADKPPPSRFASPEDLVEALREKLAGAGEPDVALLNLLDARHAKSLGRFREAVLLSWSVIDSSFVQRFDALVDEKLAGEWGEAKKFLKGLDFGLRHKMTSGLRLVAARSFFDEPDGFWARLSKSYDRRNRIIHEGAAADEEDAEQAIAVAQKVLDIIDTL